MKVELEIPYEVVDEIVRNDLQDSLKITSQLDGEDDELVLALRKVIQYYMDEPE